MAIANHPRWRSFLASICLLAVGLLYAPVAGAWWSAYSARCCTSGQCSITAHHHQKTPAATAHHHASEMDCGHEMACSMSCCHDAERPAVASVIFVLPAPIQIFEPSALQSSIAPTEVPDLLRSIEPLSPPPRFVSAAV